MVQSVVAVLFVGVVAVVVVAVVVVDMISCYHLRLFFLFFLEKGSTDKTFYIQ